MFASPSLYNLVTAVLCPFSFFLCILFLCIFLLRQLQEHGYWLVLGSSDGEELLALKRMVAGTRGRRQQTELAFFSPEELGPQDVKLYLIPDAVMGMEQCHDIKMVCVEDEDGGAESESESGSDAE